MFFSCINICQVKRENLTTEREVRGFQHLPWDLVNISAFNPYLCINPMKYSPKFAKMKKVNKQCLLDTPRTVRVSEKTWQVIVRTGRPLF